MCTLRYSLNYRTTKRTITGVRTGLKQIGTIMNQTIGYARVSSNGQSLEVQLDKLMDCDKVFKEKRSGTQTGNRPELLKALDYVREGDSLVITRLDRMARSVIDLAKIAENLKKKGVALKVLDQSIDTSTSEGKLMFHMLGAFAEFENDIRRERQQDGIAKAQANGVRFGRKPVLSDEQQATIRRLRTDEGFTIAQLMERFQIGRTTVYRALGNYSDQ
jgi:DNA invertase Pin-like site-specific DNA recombinase